MKATKRGLLSAIDSLLHAQEADKYHKVSIGNIFLNITGGTFRIGNLAITVGPVDVKADIMCLSDNALCSKLFAKPWLRFSITGANTNATLGIVDFEFHNAGRSTKRVASEFTGDFHAIIKRLSSDDGLKVALRRLYEIVEMGYSIDSIPPSRTVINYSSGRVWGGIQLPDKFKYMGLVEVTAWYEDTGQELHVWVKLKGDWDLYVRMVRLAKEHFLKAGAGARLDTRLYEFGAVINGVDLGTAYSTLASFLRDAKEIVGEEARSRATRYEPQPA